MIQDQFTNLLISKQRKYQLRKKARGLCIICNRKLSKSSSDYCAEHKKATSSKEAAARKKRVAAGKDLRSVTGNGKTGKRKKTAPRK